MKGNTKKQIRQVSKGVDINAEPVVKSKTHEETFSEILTVLKQHNPEHQNWILRELLKQTAFSRHADMMALKEDLMRSEANFKEFLDLQHVAESALKESR